MYWEYFGFREPPFALTPNPAFLYLSSPHQEAFAHLLFAIENRVGFIELSGEVGAGKTTLIRTLLNQLEPQTHRSALIFNPTLSPLGLLKEINAEFGIASEGAEIRDLHQALNVFLLEENRAGRTVVLVIDEAQNLSVEVLEHLRMISNLETDSDKLIQIVLVGQPELRTLLAREDLRQLRQRITIRYHLQPMCFADSCDYIRHRMRFAAGGREPLSFTQGAFKRIFKHSGGLPRLINGVCDRALLLAYTRESKEITASMVAASIADLQKEGGRRFPTWTWKAVGASFAAVAVTAGVVIALRGEGKLTVQKVAPQAPAMLSRAMALNELGVAGEQQNLLTAVNAVLSAWQMPPLAPVNRQAASVKSLARERGLEATTVTGDLDSLARLDAPALLTVAVPGGGKRVLALTAIGKDSVRVTPTIAGRKELRREELAQIWSGEATILWKDFHGLTGKAKAADRAEGVKQLQGLLKSVGCYQGKATGIPGRKTQAALADFQRRERLKVDGQASGQTLLLLYRKAGGFFPPTLTTRDLSLR